MTHNVIEIQYLEICCKYILKIVNLTNNILDSVTMCPLPNGCTTVDTTIECKNTNQE